MQEAAKPKAPKAKKLKTPKKAAPKKAAKKIDFTNPYLLHKKKGSFQSKKKKKKKKYKNQTQQNPKQKPLIYVDDWCAGIHNIYIKMKFYAIATIQLKNTTVGLPELGNNT